MGRHIQREKPGMAYGIFGSPTFMLGEEIFWGDDRFEDAVAWCKAHADSALNTP